jgi:hypothetical protein
MDEFRARRRFIDHPKAERFDSVTVDTVERWKESELSGDEWRFSYVATFWLHGKPVAKVRGASVQDALLQAAAAFGRVKPDDGISLNDIRQDACCQPGCPNPWVVLMHPTKAGCGPDAKEWWPGQVRGFCDRHRHRHPRPAPRRVASGCRNRRSVDRQRVRSHPCRPQPVVAAPVEGQQRALPLGRRHARRADRAGHPMSGIVIRDLAMAEAVPERSTVST